jgi:hypothetical protein
LVRAIAFAALQAILLAGAMLLLINLLFINPLAVTAKKD